jgi:hypothetical protein
MNWKNIWKGVSVIATTFAGGAIVSAEHALEHGLPATSVQWHSFEAGCLVAGLAALGHLWQSAPGAIVVTQGGAST